MADQLLTVEVVTELSSLSTGLDKATKDISNFVNTSIPGINNLQKVLNSLGVNTVAQGGLDQMKTALASQRLETEKARTAAAEYRAEQVRMRQAVKESASTQLEATGSIAQARRELSELGKQIVNSSNSMNMSDPIIGKLVKKYADLNAAIKGAEMTMGNHQRDVGNYGKVWDGFANHSQRAGDSLTNLNRIVQDAPFGFVAIQNNLNPMLESFQRLKAETGSTGSALSAMASALTGPAGIGIALAVVSAGILLWDKYQQSSKKSTEANKKAVTEYAETLGQVEQAHLKGGIAALKEQTELSTLYSITQNVTLSNKQRNAAVDELQNKYPAYFKNLDDETIKNGGAKDAYDRLTTSIIATARARAAQDIITKNSTRGLENEQKLADADIAYGKAKLAQQTALNKMKEPGQSGSARFYAHEAENAEKEQAKWAKVITDLKTDDTILNDRNLKLTESVTDEIKKGADLTGKVGAIDAPKKAKEIKTLTDVLKDLNVELLQSENKDFSGTFGDRQKEKVNAYQKAIDSLIKMGVDPASASIEKLKQAQKDLFKGDLGSAIGKPGDVSSLIPAKTEIKPVLNIVPNITGMTDFEKQIADYNDKIEAFKNKVLDSGIAETMGGSFSAIGAAMVQGGNVFAAAGKSVISAIGSYLSELGQMLIKKGIATVAAGIALNIIVPGSGSKEVGGGLALIAAGTAMAIGSGAIGASTGASSNGGSAYNKNTGPQYGVPHFASGGIVSGPTLAMVGEYPGAAHDPEIISPLSKLKGMINSNGGGSDATFIISNKIHMGELVTAIERQKRNDNRG